MKNAVAKVWPLAPSSDGNRWSAWKAGDRPASVAVYDHDYRWDSQGTWSSDGGNSRNPIIVTLNTPASGFTLLVPLASEPAKTTTPSDNASNTFTLLHSSGFAGGAWPTYGLEVWVDATAAGRSGHVISATKDAAADEVTLGAYAIQGTVLDHSIVARTAPGAGQPITSGSVVVPTGKVARLHTTWVGDGGTGLSTYRAAPSAGWTMEEFYWQNQEQYIQQASATKDVVVGPGTYTVQWTAEQDQGGIISLVAIGL